MASESDSDCDQYAVDMLHYNPTKAATAGHSDESDNDGVSDSGHFHDLHRDKLCSGTCRVEDLGSSDEEDIGYARNRSITYDPGPKDATGSELQLYKQPIPGTSGAITPIGGTVSTGSKEITTYIPDKLAKELLQAVTSTSIDDKDTRAVHFHVNKTEIKASAVTVGGQVILKPTEEGESERVKPPEAKHVQTPPNQVHSIRQATESRIEEWTRGMVYTAATKLIVKKIQGLKSWVIVTGGPGVGKTTAAYLALKQLQDMGRQVYEIATQEEYFKVKETKGPIIMLNDILGASQFNMSNLVAWRPVLNDMFELKEHKSGGSAYSQRQKQICVILVSRSSVLTSAADHMDKLKYVFLDDESVVSLDTNCSQKENFDIWRYHAEMYKVSIDEKTVRDVLQVSLSSGFPSCCRLFASMYSKNSNMSMKSFFLKPIEFLNQSITSVLQEPAGGQLLREILKHGRLELDNVSDDEKRYQYKAVVKRYRGIYLSEINGTVMFSHPSVYDSVAFLMCKKDPLFVIKYCTLSFLNERVRFQNIGHQNDADALLTVPISYTNCAKYIERLKTEISDGNLSIALSHASFHTNAFVEKFMETLHASCQNLPEPDFIKDLIKKRDKTSGKSFLFHSTISKSENVLKYICSMVDLSPEEQIDALFGICEQSSISSLEFLLSKYRNIPLNARNSAHETPLLVASKKSSAEILKMLFAKGVDVTVRDKEGNSVLCNICVNGVEGEGDVVEMLLDEKDDLRTDECIHIAARNGHTNVVTTLASRGADINRTDGDGRTPFQHACEEGCIDVVTSLMNKGVDIKKTDNDGMTALHYACLGGNVQVMTVLFAEDIDVNKPDSNGRIPCHYACKGGHVHALMALIERGVNINKTDRKGTTPFHFACAGGHVEVMKALMDRNVDVNKIDSDGRTPYHMACEGGHVDAMELLRDSVDISKSDNGDRTTSDNASAGEQVEVMKTPMDKDVDVKTIDNDSRTPHHVACGGGHVDAMALLRDSGVDINNSDNGNRATSDNACVGEQVEVMKTPMDRDVDVKTIDNDGRTPHHVTCGGGHVDAMALLRDSGVDINNSDNGDKSFSYKACAGEQVEVMKTPMDRDVDVKTIDNEGGTPYHVACGGGHVDANALLGDSGVDINKSDNGDRTASDNAHIREQVEVIYTRLG